MTRWFWLESDDGKGWWDCTSGDFSIIIGFAISNGVDPVYKDHKGPWNVQVSTHRGFHTYKRTFKTLIEAKRYGVEKLAKEFAKTVGAMKKDIRRMK